MKQILDRVTITGADDNTDPSEMLAITGDFPFVEWGVLMSKSSMGRPRYPSADWLIDIEDVSMHMNLSAHLCGSVVRALLIGVDDFWPGWEKSFKRAQLNFHAEPHNFMRHECAAALQQTKYQNLQWIFQIDRRNGYYYFRHTVEEAETKLGAVRLFDLSGGAGILPDEWPTKLQHEYVGYAGGLSPDNVADQLTKLCDITNGPCWIDAETRLRSDDGATLDMGKVRAFLEAAKPRVIGA